MEYTINIENIKDDNIIFKLPIKNQNSKYINYYKIIYSNHILNLKYLVIKLNFFDYNLISDSNCYKLSINKSDNFFNKIKNMENIILNCLNIHINKKITTSLYNDMINKDFIYSFSSFPNIKQLYLKISGVWESETSIGLVYKLYYNMSTEKLSSIIC